MPEEITRRGICLCAQVLIEYWVVATRPASRNGFGLTPAEAEADIMELRRLLPGREIPVCPLFRCL